MDPAQPQSCDPGFPVHTAVATFLLNLGLAILVFLAFTVALDALPNLSEPALQQHLILISGGVLLGWYLFVHVFTISGLLPAFLGVALVALVPWLAGSAPLAALPVAREVLRHTPQTWLIGAHAVRVAAFLFLSLFDVGLLPGGFAVPAGWGGLIIGVLAMVVAHAFGTSSAYRRDLGVGFNVLGLLDLVISLSLGAGLLPFFTTERQQRGEPVSYLWYTVAPALRFTMPLLVLLHGYSLWKLFTEKDQPFMLWQDEEDETEAAAGVYEIE